MIVFTQEFLVEKKDTAKELGSGDLEILATPALLAKVEDTAKVYLGEALAEEETSVGTSISVKHSKPSKVGSLIRIEVTVDAQEKNKIDFSFQVFQEDSLIAEGTHQRAVVLTVPFLKKLDLFS